MQLELVCTELWSFKLRYSRYFLNSMVWSLCYQLLLQFSIDLFKTLHSGHIQDVHVVF